MVADNVRRSAIKKGMQFAIPLRPIGYALGVVVKYAARSRIAVIALFGPAKLAPPVYVVDVNPSQAILVAQVADSGMVEGEWTLVGTLPDFTRSQWPGDVFARRDGLGRWFIEQYDHEDPNLLLRSDPSTSERARHLPMDTLYGHVALQGVLSDLIDARELLWDEWMQRRQTANQSEAPE